MRKLPAARRIAIGLLIALVASAALALTTIGGTDIPEWLAQKLEFEAKHDEIAREQREKCAKEVQELEEKRAEAPRDAKGNPIISGKPVVQKPVTISPREDLGVIQTTTTVYLPSPVRERFAFTSQASAPYDVLIAGSNQDDETIGVIFQVIFDSPDEIQVKEFSYPGNGPIVLDSLEEDNQVVTFQWGVDGKGYFDLKNSVAVFEEYST